MTRTLVAFVLGAAVTSLCHAAANRAPVAQESPR